MSKKNLKRREAKKKPLMTAKEKKKAKKIKKSDQPNWLQIKTRGS